MIRPAAFLSCTLQPPSYTTWSYLKRNELARDHGRRMFLVDELGETVPADDGETEERLPWEDVDGAAIDWSMTRMAEQYGWEDPDLLEALMEVLRPRPQPEAIAQRLAYLHTIRLSDESRDQVEVEEVLDAFNGNFCRRCRIYGCRTHSECSGVGREARDGAGPCGPGCWRAAPAGGAAADAAATSSNGSGQRPTAATNGNGQRPTAAANGSGLAGPSGPAQGQPAQADQGGRGRSPERGSHSGAASMEVDGGESAVAREPRPSGRLAGEAAAAAPGQEGERDAGAQAQTLGFRAAAESGVEGAVRGGGGGGGGSGGNGESEGPGAPCLPGWTVHDLSLVERGIQTLLTNKTERSLVVSGRAQHGTNEPWQEYQPCTCVGKCKADCPCVRAHNFCEKFCACSTSCKERFRGCNCKSGCKNNMCPCSAAGRECDPDLCGGCAPTLEGRAEPGRECHNMRLRMRQHTHVVLGTSDIPGAGWGLFSAQYVSKNGFLGEYTGDLITQDEANRRGSVYLFNLNTEWVVDAKFRGNKLRCANHSHEPVAKAKVLLVDGESRIAIFADKNVTPGMEITYDYRYSDDTAPHWVKQKRGG
ncbi:Histone-lysine N-methyltransferase EZA1 [Tetrabaena socialis]|uniref:Histone-lysine N-methyltransferase EZA1 n=1 Tax=Tetrabaena socialis TaxID=47790 RepID=A0A2J8A3H9_9CHLO|nr:Histone-lysine N-methyltransferase EZA1 [Tetrabaena socialis]|eukprot:PNH07048.1 Histone-lysine N-methyltransferase EZA1 [Tetrabaena socialis]